MKTPKVPKEGYTRLSDGFLPGQRCDPDHDGDTDAGSSYNYNGSTGSFLYMREPEDDD